MKKDLSQTKGTIAHVLCENCNIIWAQPNTIKMKEVVLQLLDSEELKNNPSVPEAKQFFKETKNQAQFTALLMTYMTGNSLSKK